MRYSPPNMRWYRAYLLISSSSFLPVRFALLSGLVRRVVVLPGRGGEWNEVDVRAPSVSPSAQVRPPGAVRSLRTRGRRARTTGDDVDDREKSLSSVLKVLARLTLPMSISSPDRAGGAPRAPVSVSRGAGGLLRARRSRGGRGDRARASSSVGARSRTWRACSMRGSPRSPSARSPARRRGSTSSRGRTAARAARATGQSASASPGARAAGRPRGRRPARAGAVAPPRPREEGGRGGGTDILLERPQILLQLLLLREHHVQRRHLSLPAAHAHGEGPPSPKTHARALNAPPRGGNETPPHPPPLPPPPTQPREPNPTHGRGRAEGRAEQSRAGQGRAGQRAKREKGEKHPLTPSLPHSRPHSGTFSRR